ncbi:MAG: hypothetical protein KJ070_00725 [Verrucomicrobia bacterium]|nr:hypothetical protein [Verrucomicrobiota bacterium]
MSASSLLAQTNFHTLVTNGPAANRLNLVFLAEGYTSNQFNLFLTHATNTANILLSNSPFAEYRSHFNVFAIAVASAQSGSDRPVDGITRNTYFNSTYGNGVTVREELISIPPNWTNGNHSQGQGKVDNLLQTFMPATDLAIMLVNDLNLGGSDGAGKVAITSIAPNSLSDIPVHESGHVLANLGDEYVTPNPGYPDTEEPNTTRETNRALIKWNAWITPDTPIPTPPTFDYQEVVGLFEGAHYNATGWYRPKLNCRMGSLGVPFCEVCREALVLSFYRNVRLVDSFSPANTNLAISSPDLVQFALTTLQPIGHTLTVQWLTNGIPIATATNTTLTVSPDSLNNGLNVIAAQISDPTPFVRTDPQDLLRQTVTWMVNVSLPAMELSAPRWLNSNQFAFRISGVAPQGFAIQTSTNLTDWASVATNFLVNGQFDYTNQAGANPSARLFRAVTPPR